MHDYGMKEMRVLITLLQPYNAQFMEIIYL